MTAAEAVTVAVEPTLSPHDALVALVEAQTAHIKLLTDVLGRPDPAGVWRGLVEVSEVFVQQAVDRWLAAERAQRREADREKLIEDTLNEARRTLHDKLAEIFGGRTLASYAHHDSRCTVMQPPNLGRRIGDVACSCGLDAALAALGIREDLG